ncbi:MAG: citrate synthase [Candidatus Dormibacteria bacterium]
MSNVQAVAPAKGPIMVPAGLEGVAVAETTIGAVRGEEGFFHYRGYNGAELARHCSFEQVWYLLIEGELPDAEQTRIFRKDAAGQRTLPEPVAKLLPQIAAVEPFVPLNALRTSLSLVASALDLKPTMDIPAEEVRQEAVRMTALVPVLLTSLYRLHNGEQPVTADPDLGFAAAYLQMLTGTRPDDERARAVETYLTLTMDHGFNASTFTARVIASTGADMGSALVGAIGALSGPLHGGAPSRALHTLDEIGTADRAYPYLREKVESGERLMGFGHRVYKTDDPRSTLLREVALKLGGEQARFAEHVEKTALQVLNELKPGRRLYTNVEFYAGVVMNTAGIPRDMFTPTFASSRTVGWTAGICEQVGHNRLIRPSALYVGPASPRELPSDYQYV